MRSAIQYALKHKRRSVTIVHKGNIMKFTEGAFKDWSYAVATREFRALFDELSSGRTRMTPGTLAIIASRVFGLGPAALVGIGAVALVVVSPTFGGTASSKYLTSTVTTGTAASSPARLIH